MRNATSIILFCMVFMGCSANKSIKTTYEVGLVNFEFNQTESILVNRLGIKPKHSHKDLQKLMFQNFGKWANAIPKKDHTPYLVCKDVPLLNGSDERFTVAVSGKYATFEIVKLNGKAKYGELNYCSAIVFNAEGNDCLKEDSGKRDRIAAYFIKAMKTINLRYLRFEKAFNNSLLKS